MPHRAGLKEAAYQSSSLVSSRPESKRKGNEGKVQQYKVEENSYMSTSFYSQQTEGLKFSPFFPGLTLFGIILGGWYITFTIRSMSS